MPHTADCDRDPLQVPLVAGFWHVCLLGRVEARSGPLLITRFNSQPTAALLARLALEPHRLHPREELAELLWPGATAEVGRNRLRQALSTLKRLLEPPGAEGGPVFVADRHGVRVRPHALTCDALEFERCFRRRRHGQARTLYRGELMPGHHGDWVHEERQRLAALYDRLEVEVVEPGELDRAPRGVVECALVPAAHLLPAPSLQLPAPLTRFFGRETERSELLAAIAESRLVTLTGVGGCGKTRLALEAARRAAGYDSVVFVPLAACDTVAQAVSQLHASAQLVADAQDPIEQLAQTLSQRRILFVLDNFEQLVAVGGADLVEDLLDRAGTLHLLVTSRRVLGVPGERELPLQPLPLPVAGAELQDVARNVGVALFIDRARTVRPDFQVTARNQEALISLCRALEGVPLAIELAAARSRVFSLRELNDALAEPLALLERTGRRAGRMPRQDSLRGAIEWSWRLLDARQQDLLSALSVFRGGWTVDEAQSVCEEPQARLLLESLLADSLLFAALAGSGGLRFGMLELIREFVAEKLAPVRAQALRAQHRAHVLTLALGLQARGAGVVEPDELPNVRQALHSAVEDGQPELALTLGVALRSHWDSQGMAPELLALLCRAAAGAGAGAPALPTACAMLALLLLAAGQLPAARLMAERSLELAGARPAQRAAALCAWVQVVADGERRYEGLDSCLHEALNLAAGHPELLARATSLQGTLAARAAHDPIAAEALFDRAAHHWIIAGRVREARLLRYDRAISLREAGRLAEALEQAEQCERECLAIGEHARRVAAINLQGVVLAMQRRWRDAVVSYGRCAREAWTHHQHYWLAFALWNHGRNLARLRLPAEAARLMAFSASHWTRNFDTLDASDLRYLRLVRRLVRAQLGRAAADRAWEEGKALTLAEAVALSGRCSSCPLDAGATPLLTKR